MEVTPSKKKPRARRLRVFPGATPAPPSRGLPVPLLAPLDGQRDAAAPVQSRGDVDDMEVVLIPDTGRGLEEDLLRRNRQQLLHVPVPHQELALVWWVPTWGGRTHMAPVGTPHHHPVGGPGQPAAIWGCRVLTWSGDDGDDKALCHRLVGVPVVRQHLQTEERHPPPKKKMPALCPVSPPWHGVARVGTYLDDVGAHLGGRGATVEVGWLVGVTLDVP